jgi:hypothetical protein
MFDTLTPYLQPEVLALLGGAAAVIVAYFNGNLSRAADEAEAFETDLRNYIANNASVPLPDNEEVSGDDIRSAILEEYGDEAANATMLFDGTYYATDRSGFDAMTRFDPTNFLPYRPARFDCENFAMLFQSLSAFLFGVNSVGTVIDWSGGHAYNIVYLTDGSLLLYEPQTDEVVEVGDALSGDETYVMENVDILF